jgi:hypothetical protein
LKEIIIVFEELSPPIGDSTMQFYLSMRNRDSKLDVMQSGIPEGCALAPPLVTTMVIFLLQVLLFFLQLCLLLRFVISMTVTMIITIPATVQFPALEDISMEEILQI